MVTKLMVTITMAVTMYKSTMIQLAILSHTLPFPVIRILINFDLQRIGRDSLRCEEQHAVG